MPRTHRSSWVIPALGLGIVAAGLYGLSEHQQNAAALVALDGAYGGALHGMVSDADHLRAALGAANSVHSIAQVRTQLAQAGEYAALGSADASRVDTHVLAQRGLQTFFGSAHARIGHLLEAADGGALTSAERLQLGQLEHQTTVVTARLRGVQAGLLDAGVRPSDLAMAAERGAGRVESPALRRLQAVDRFAREHTQTAQVMRVAQAGSGVDIGRSRAEAIARKTLGFSSQVMVQTTRFGPAYPQPGYLVHFLGRGGQSVATVGVMQHSGIVISLDRAHSDGAPRLTMAQARSAALIFLRRQAGAPVALSDEDSYGTVGAFTFVPSVRGVRLEDEPVFVKVSLVNGQVVNYDGVNLATGSLPAVSLHARWPAAAIRRDVQPQVRVGPAALAVIRVNGTPTLVWDTLLERGDDTYRAWMDADTGKLVRIVQLTKAEAAMT